MAIEEPADKDQQKQDEQKRESGLPGGGKGRKDEVGGSGVYPLSGPLPPSNAPLRGQMEWGQGERGNAGYEDHGESELTLAPAPPPQPQTTGAAVQQGQEKSPKRQATRRWKEPRKNRAA